MQQLVGQRADLVVPGLGQVDREMQAGHDGELPAPAEAEVEGQRIQHAVDEQMIPVAPLRFRKVRSLEEVIPHQVTKNEFEDRFEHGHRLNLPFPADFSVDREHARTGLSCPGDRPWGGVTHARVYVIVQRYALFARYSHAFRDSVPLLTKKRQSRTIKDYLRTFKEGCEQTVRRFEDAIERAKESCKSASQPIEKHFAGAGKMYKISLESFMLISQASCRSQGCRIAHVRPQMQHTPPCDGAYVALECAGGRFCNLGFGKFLSFVPFGIDCLLGLARQALEVADYHRIRNKRVLTLPFLFRQQVSASDQDFKTNLLQTNRKP